MSFSLERVSYLTDIEPKHLWIAPAAALSAYLLPIFLKKVFSGKHDKYPLSEARLKIYYIHHNIIRDKHPDFYRCLHMQIQDNLHFAVLIVALIVLKKSAPPECRSPSVIIMGTLAVCALSTCVRDFNSFILHSISETLPTANPYLGKIGRICKNISLFIASSNLD